MKAMTLSLTNFLEKIVIYPNILIKRYKQQLYRYLCLRHLKKYILQMIT